MEEAEKKRILRQRLKESERKLELAKKVIELQNEQIEKLNKFIDFKETEARLAR